MRRAIIEGVWRLSRAQGALLAFSLILIPYGVHAGKIWPAVWLALPIIPIAMCTFILNDINDIERDCINHPTRPLPSGLLSIKGAALIYLVLFASSLALVRAVIGAPGSGEPVAPCRSGGATRDMSRALRPPGCL